MTDLAAHAARIRVRYAETDNMGVAYYANYFVWFEVGRCELLRALGRSYGELEREGVRLPVIDAYCRYRDAARYDDDLEIATTGRLLSPVRVEFHYDIVRSSDSAHLASGRTVHAAVDTAGRPRRLPESVQALLQ